MKGVYHSEVLRSFRFSQGQELAYNVLPVLTLIINTSLHQGKLPRETTMLVPVFKMVSPMDPGQYLKHVLEISIQFLESVCLTICH